MKKILLSLFTLVVALPTFAASKINYLNVDGDAVHFSLAEAKSHTIPSCVAAGTTDRYAVLLTNEAGRAMYSLLITAMASKQAVTVESANDCADVAGVERPKGVSIVPITMATNGGGKSIYLYKGDGVTKLGRILNTTDNRNNFWYFPVDDNTQVMTYNNTKWLSFKASYSLYFKEVNCIGIAYIQNSSTNTPWFVKNISFNNGKLLLKGGTEYVTPRSILSRDGSCVNQSSVRANYYMVTPYTDPLCGDNACIFKEE